MRSITPPLPKMTQREHQSGPASCALVYEPWAYDRHPEERRQKLRLVLEKSILAAGFAPLSELEDGGFQHGMAMAESSTTRDGGRRIIVHVKHHPYRSGGTSMMLAGLTLGIIPGWETYPVYTVDFVRYEGGRQVAASTCVIQQTDMAHLVLLPFIWLNWMVPSSEDEFRKAIASRLHVAGTTKAP